MVHIMARTVLTLAVLSLAADMGVGADTIKVLFLGSPGGHNSADLHPRLSELVHKGITFTYTESMADITTSNLAGYDALLFYGHYHTIETAKADAIIEYVEGGGGYVPIHYASGSFTNNARMVALTGARFVSHGYTTFRTTITAPDHPVMSGFAGFESLDETYKHDHHNDVGRTVLSRRQTDGDNEPWTWVRTQGNGRVFYTAWGHDFNTWNKQGFLDLVERGIRFAAGADPVTPVPTPVPTPQPTPPTAVPTPAPVTPTIKVLFLGSPGDLHKSGDLHMRLSELVPKGITFTYTESMADITTSNLAGYDALLFYGHYGTIETAKADAIIEYVEGGGGYVPIHSASDSFTNDARMVALTGARFVSHGYTTFRTTITAPDHPVMSGFAGFESLDETYKHDHHNDVGRTVLSRRQTDGDDEPWTWVRTQGNGRVFYTAWGHDFNTWNRQGFLDLVERGIRFAAGADPVTLVPGATGVPATPAPVTPAPTAAPSTPIPSGKATSVTSFCTRDQDCRLDGMDPAATCDVGVRGSTCKCVTSGYAHANEHVPLCMADAATAVSLTARLDFGQNSVADVTAAAKADLVATLSAILGAVPGGVDSVVVLRGGSGSGSGASVVVLVAADPSKVAELATGNETLHTLFNTRSGSGSVQAQRAARTLAALSATGSGVSSGAACELPHATHTVLDQSNTCQAVGCTSAAARTMVDTQSTCQIRASESDDDLSTGALVGIVVGASIAALLVVGGVVAVVMRKKKSATPATEPANEPSAV